MQVESLSIGKQSIPSSRYSSGVGYIAIPSDVDRATFIQQCYRINRVSIRTENAEFFNNVPIDKSAIQQIEFPAESDEIGSPVMWVNVEPNHQLVIVAVLEKNDHTSFLNEKRFRLSKVFGRNKAIIDGDGGNGNLLITLDSDQDNGGVLNIVLNNKNKRAKLNIHVNGSAEVYCTEKLTIKANNGLEYKDEFGNTITAKEKETNISADKITHNGGKEPMLLGDTSIQFLSDLMDQLGKESAGPYPLFGQSIYLKFKERLEKLKSKKSFLE
jgi:hypothetical protein